MVSVPDMNSGRICGVANRVVSRAIIVQRKRETYQSFRNQLRRPRSPPRRLPRRRFRFVGELLSESLRYGFQRRNRHRYR